MLEAWARSQALEQGDLRELLATSDARAALQTLARISGRSLRLAGPDGEEICRSDDGVDGLFSKVRGATAPVEPLGRLVGYVHVLGVDAEGAGGANLAHLIAACLADRVTVASLDRRSPFLPSPRGSAEGLPWEDSSEDLMRIVELTAGRLEAEKVALLMRRAPAGRSSSLLDVVASRGLPEAPGGLLVLRASEGPLREGLEAPGPRRVETTDRDFGLLRPLLGPGTIILAPVRGMGAGVPQGLLSIGGREDRPFGEADCAAAADSAVLAGNLLERARRLSAQHRHLVGSLEAVVEAAELSGARRGHGSRTSRLAARVAEAMGLPEFRVRDVEIAATLHDIGCLGTQSIRGERGDCEHAAWGAALLETSTAFAHLAPIVRHHHDPWDGPGRSGEDLPLGARIVSVCDAFDHLTFPIRGRALPVIEALDRLQGEAGRAYDPSVLSALRRTYD